MTHRDSVPEPVKDADGEPVAWRCPECNDQCWTEAKALACCADESGESADSPRESTVEGENPNAKGGCEAGSSAPTDAFGPIDDPEFDESTEAVREHYRRAGPVLDALESVDGFPTSAFAGNSGWYRYTDAGDLDREAFDAGWRSFRRAYTIENDREELLDAIQSDADDPSWRSLYAITSYKDPEALYDGAYSKERRGGFDGGEGLPDYADIRALPFWIDVDLADDRDDALDPEDETEYGVDLKARRGDLDPRELRIVERALGLIVEEVADVYDLPPEAIAAFDSGGGFYPFGPAAATVPIADRYDDPEDRERLFDELTDRMNAYVAGDEDTPGTVDAYGFEGIIPRVERKVPGTKYLLDADALLNKNRQTKAPGSIHKSHDVVVTPLRDETGTVDYTPATVSEFAENNTLRTRTVAETRKFTEDTPEARACVEPLVATLFPEYADRDDLDGWTDVLDAWLADERERERERVHATARDDLRRRERREEQREELADDLGREPTTEEVSDALAGQRITTVRQDQFDDLDRIDTEEIIRNYAADRWDTSNRGHETTFDPSWRSSGSGKSCAIPNGSDTFVDNKCNGGGGPAKAYALGTGILPQTKDAAAITLNGRKWGEAVDGLRGEGCDIRVYVPEAGSEDSNDDGVTPFGALRRAAVTLDVCSPDEFKEHETDDGDTYLGFDRETFNEVLDALDEAGVDHGREHIDGGVSGDGRQYEPEQCAPPETETEEFDREQRWNELQNERYQAYLDAQGPHIWGDAAGVGKSTNAERGAAARDRPYFVAFDKHAKARAAITDDATPEGQFHIKGGEQPREDCCMDAAAARAVEAHGDETPHCPTHGHPADWPRMCPIYNRPTDDDLRQRHEALVSLGGQLFAHLRLGLFDEDKHPWHGGQCRWAEMFDHLLDEDGNPLAERVAGVHEYQLLKSAAEGRDGIVDESPRTLASEARVEVDDLVHAQVRLEGLADIHESNTEDELLADNLRALAGFVDDLTRAIARDEPMSFEDLDTNEIRPMTFDRTVNPEDLPPGVDPEDVERTTWREYQGVNNDHYTEHERYTAPVEAYAEPLTKAKLEYNEGLVRQYQDTDKDLPTAPFCFDAILAAVGKAGIEHDDVRRAIATPEVLDTCPWCGSGLDDENGARVCASDECDWNERENTITQQDGERARASAWVDDDPENLRGDDPALVYESLPAVEDLPDDPLILDATATPEKVAGLYGARTDEVEVTGETPLDLGGKFHLTQVVGGRHGRGESERYHAGGQYHKQTIKDTPSIQRRIQDAIEQLCEIHERPLFGIQQDLISGFNWPDNAVVVYYGGARGLNYEECDAVCCIGAPHPDMNDIQRKAELLAMDNSDLRVGGDEFSTRRDAPNPPVYRKLLYEDENGDGLAVPTKAFSGLVGALYQEARENELEQFVHRVRPHLVEDGEPMKHGYLLTDVPTDLAVDEVAGFEELVDPLSALFPAPEGAIRLLGHARDELVSDGPDGFRASRLIEERDDGTVSNKVAGWHDLADAHGMDVTKQTVYNWIHALESAGLLNPGEYEQRRGVSYTADISTLKTALQVLSCNGGLKVAAVQRLGAKIRESDGSLDWLAWAESVFDLSGDRCGWDPPPDPA